MSESSSNELNIGNPTDSVKDKKRACDRCRRLKRRCDGGQVCSQCAGQKIVCAYQEQSVIRTVADIQGYGGAYSRDYVEHLELRLKTAEDALQKLRAPGQHLVSGALRGLIKNTLPHPDDYGPHGIAASFQALSLDGPPPDPGFQGESSAAMLVKVAVAIKSGKPSLTDEKSPAPKPWTLQLWDDRSTVPYSSFPDHNLIDSLVSLYFSNVNIFFPVLHRPIFEDAVAHGLHLRQDDFASTLRLTCALGSLYLIDSRLSRQERLKLAWKFYNQVELCGHSLRRQPTTYDLQAYCLAALFLRCAYNLRASWAIVGFGLHFVQDIGSHRRNLRAPRISTEEELEKRATWILIVLDAQLGAALGRNTTLNPFDLDIGLPSECDDEYWQISGPGDQPKQTPSTMAFFNCMVGLYRLLHFLLKNLYSTSRYYTAAGIDDMRPIAAELEITLNKWFSSIPQHLFWDPDRQDTLFFDQSAALHCFYDYTRILIHRPFIPALRLNNQPELHALRTCNRAARACINVVDIHRRRRPDNPLFFGHDPLFTAAMVLILNMWGRPQHADDRAQDLAQLHIALDIFKSSHERWPSSGFFVIVLERLLALDYIPTELPDDLPDGVFKHDPFIGTVAEGFESVRKEREPESWMAFAQAWMAGSHLQPPIPQVISMPPVFAGDQDVPQGRYRRPYADLKM
ncbi:fungal-specific transcription factor domain-containing protein [Mycena capillaripes]|nr:fungal-specific transcription factor domain-containing protein [Mycena capillaripes]